MIKLSKEDREQLIYVSENKKVFLEGNIIKLIDDCNDETFREYLALAKEKDAENRKKRLEVTRKVQEQNKKLEEKAIENEALVKEIKEALSEAEGAKEAAINDLDLIQKKEQFELIGQIVKVALWVIMGVGIITTALYSIALFNGNVDTTLLGNTWSNLFGILLTNSFSIIGTIMGVKYAAKETSHQSKDHCK